jgi:hypothetical protein
MTKIPPALIGTSSPILANAYTHTELDSLFFAAGFPGDPPQGNKVAKCQDWLRRANNDATDPLALYGRLIAEFMDTEPTATRPWLEDEPDPREPIRAALTRENLSYLRGGSILGASLTGPSRSLGGTS